MKCCKTCKANLPDSAFSKNHKAKDGSQSSCKTCASIYLGAYNEVYLMTERAKALRRAASMRFYKTEKGKASTIRYPDRNKARRAVNNAVRAFKLPRASTLKCAYHCGRQAEQYHHWKGYEPEHWLDVVPACRSCDQQWHRDKETA